MRTSRPFDAALRLCLIAGVASVFGVSGPVHAQDTAKVHFAAGASSTTVNGSVVGRDYVDYVIGARAGQTMTASLKVDGTNGNGTVYFNVLPPGSDNEAIFIGSMSDDGRANVRLPQNGDYKIRVYLMGNDRDTGKTVGYSIDIAIR